MFHILGTGAGGGGGSCGDRQGGRGAAWQVSSQSASGAAGQGCLVRLWGFKASFGFL